MRLWLFTQEHLYGRILFGVSNFVQQRTTAEEWCARQASAGASIGSSNSSARLAGGYRLRELRALLWRVHGLGSGIPAPAASYSKWLPASGAERCSQTAAVEPAKGHAVHRQRVEGRARHLELSRI